MKQKSHVTIYEDGAVIRLHNRKVSFIEKNGSTLIQFITIDKESEKPACLHKCYKGKMKVTLLKVENETIDELVAVYIKYKQKEI